MSPNWMSAIGEAAPAISQELRNWQAVETQQRKLKMEEEMQPIRVEEARTNAAISGEQLRALQTKNQKDAEMKKRMDAPTNVNQWIKPLGFTPENKNMIMSLLAPHGVDLGSGVGRTEDVIKGFDNIVKGKQWEDISKGQAQYYSQMYEQAAEKYEEAKTGGEGGKPKDIKAQEKTLAEMNQYQSLASQWGGILTKTMEMVRNRKDIGTTLQSMKDSGEWDALPIQDKAALSQAYQSGSTTLFQHAMDKMQARKEGTQKREIWTGPNGETQNFDIGAGQVPPRGWTKAGGTGGKVPSSGNAVDSAIRTKFGTGALTDPKLAEQADKWLSTSEGKAEVEKWAKTLTPPAITFIQTNEGLVPVTTRGPGMGTVGEPTGLKKPLTDAQTAKVGELNAVLKNIDKTKELYGYGTNNEHREWVGPVAGRTGEIGAKYLGTATPDQVKFYAYVKDMQDALLRARSGAQINEQEYKRLVNFLPDPNLPPTTFKAKLERFQEATEIVMEEKLAAFEQAGYGTGKLKGKNKSDTRQVSPISKKAWVEKAKAANKGMSQKDIEAEFDKRYREKE